MALAALGLSAIECNGNAAAGRCVGAVPGLASVLAADGVSEMIELRDLILDPDFDVDAAYARWGPLKERVGEWGLNLERSPPFANVTVELLSGRLDGVQLQWIEKKVVRWWQVLAAFGPGKELTGPAGIETWPFEFKIGTWRYRRARVVLEVILLDDGLVLVAGMIVRRNGRRA